MKDMMCGSHASGRGHRSMSGYSEYVVQYKIVYVSTTTLLLKVIT